MKKEERLDGRWTVDDKQFITPTHLNKKNPGPKEEGNMYNKEKKKKLYYKLNARNQIVKDYVLAIIIH